MSSVRFLAIMMSTVGLLAASSGSLGQDLVPVVSDERSSSIPFPKALQSRLWIPADALNAPPGALRGDQQLREFWELHSGAYDQLAGDDWPEPCARFGPSPWGVETRSDAQTAVDLVRGASAAAFGAVVGLKGGLWSGIYPGLLVQVEVTDWLWASAFYRTSRVVYFFYPRGVFAVGEHLVCAEDPHRPPPPRVGDFVLLFPEVAPIEGRSPEFVLLGSLGLDVAVGDHERLAVSDALGQIGGISKVGNIFELRQRFERIRDRLEDGR